MVPVPALAAAVMLHGSLGTGLALTIAFVVGALTFWGVFRLVLRRSVHRR